MTVLSGIRAFLHGQREAIGHENLQTKYRQLL